MSSNSYTRDQWLHSIIWKKNIYKYRNVLRTAQRPEVLLKELKNLVELSLATPLHDHTVCRVPLELASSILTTGEKWLSRQMTEEIIVTLAPLLENNQPSPEICQFFSQHCTDNPRSCLVIDMFTPIIKRILKHNVDFGKYPYVRRFVQDYIQALNSQNDGRRVVHEFVDSMHGPTSTCPHLRVLPNLVAVCTAATCMLVVENKNIERLNSMQVHAADEVAHHLACYLSVLNKICDYDDWRPGLAQLLQPIPFPDEALADEEFIRQILPVIEKIGLDPRCEVHQMVLGTRDDKEGWLNVLCPSSLACVDEGAAWAAILHNLISCCCRRKKFLGLLVKSLGACMLLALRGNSTAQEILCLMLEWKLVEGSDQSLQVVTTLQSTPSGKRNYQALCDRQMHLRELKGGPRKLTLPSRSTDADVNRMLSSGSFGNLECLSLAFTRVTSACAEQLIKLPTLRYLNLWATQFGDVGLQLISEHLHKLQVLNLCETPVTDKGLEALAAIKSLRKLNLNSTSLSVQTFETLKLMLPSLLEVDIGQWKREKEPRRTQDSSSSSSPEEKNNTRRDFKCFPKFDTKTLTKRNRLVKAKSEEQKTVERKRCLVRASSEDQHSTAAISYSFVGKSRAESLSPPKNCVLTRTKSEEHTAQTKIKLVRANSDGRRYKISNLLNERQRAVASQDALHHSE
ncbi:hypothetical protein Pcinc_039278 [Petrolisthes cinctipes]|uniref:C-Maf-inducing protein PH domain-containing protein n=1 Tax=Petrolisthes cinctipes TaxID=88211 RepID=A0AAE1BNY4_PETCI|nr:hypothetical protein Pcinc_039278 [Petrolisthes cinctipes]